MKNLCLLCFAGFALSSCNTTIGLGRDVRDGFQWTKVKIQESQNKNNDDYEYGAPVY